MNETEQDGMRSRSFSRSKKLKRFYYYYCNTVHCHAISVNSLETYEMPKQANKNQMGYNSHVVYGANNEIKNY